MNSPRVSCSHCVLHRSQPKPRRFRARTTPKPPVRFSLRLDVYPPPQVLQTTGRLRHLVLAFHVVGGVATQQGPFAPRALPRFLATTNPSATLSPSAHFPGSPVIGPTLLRRFRAGARRASPVAWLVLVTVPPLPPRRSGTAASIRFRLPMLPSPFGCGLGLRGHSLSGPHPRSLSLRPGDSHLPFGRSVDRLQSIGLPPPCYPSYGASDFCPGRSVSC